MDSKIKEVFRGKSVLITGASGFIGKVLLEKLLRDCDGIEKIYIIMRSKRNVNLKTRVDKILSSEMFNRVREENHGFSGKVQSINGDLMIPKNCGISDEDLEVLKKNVNIVIHSAASVRFDDSLKRAVTLNTIGTRSVLDLAESFQNLKAFVHVSTAYSNTNLKEIDEIIYEPILDYNKVIEACERNDVVELHKMEEFALATFPNTYVFSKNLTEKLVSDKQLPTIIVRPSIVGPSAQDPYPGWVEFKRGGAVGINFGASLGVIRTLLLDENMTAETVPVDYCANSIISAAAYICQHPEHRIKVINCTTSEQNNIKIGDFYTIGHPAVTSFYPSKNTIWFPSMTLTKYYPLYLLYFILYQILPAILVDLILLLSGRKPRLLSLQKEIYSGVVAASYFGLNEWKWKTANLEKLFDGMSAADKTIFNFDIRSTNFHELIYNSSKGSRKYIEKQTPEDLKEAKKKMKTLYFLHTLVKYTFLTLAGYFLYKIFNSLFVSA